MRIKMTSRIACFAAIVVTGCVPMPSIRTIASDLSGTVADRNGAAQSGVALHRHVYYHWTDYTQDDETTTDAKGHFLFPAIHKGSVVAIAHQPVINEELSADVDNQRVILWKVTKMDYEAAGENHGRPFTLRCVLDGQTGSCEIVGVSAH